MNEEVLGVVRVGEKRFPIRFGDVLALIIPRGGQPRVATELGKEKLGRGDRVALFNTRVAERGSIAVLTRGLHAWFGEKEINSGHSLSRGDRGVDIRQNGRNSATYASLEMNP